MRPLSVFACIALLGLFSLSHGQNDLELCGDDVALKADCDELKRRCIVNTTSADEFCGACVNGTIEDFTAPADEKLPTCLGITDITWEMFVGFFNNTLEIDNVSDAIRLVLLAAAAKYISNFNAEWPPPAIVLKLNAYSALTQEEILKRNGFNIENDAAAGIPFFNASEGRNLQDLPEKVDWTEMNAVTSVKDQGYCGCCWALAVIGALEGSAAVTSNFTFLEDLSWQQLISCDEDQLGCDGGNVLMALEYTISNPFGGVTSNEDYPFSDIEGSTTPCAGEGSFSLAVTVPDRALVVSSDWPEDSDERVLQVKTALAQQPLVVVMNADCTLFNNYGGGIITDDRDCGCNEDSCINHAVLMVGYDDTSSPPSFKIKNSWGTTWGEEGYFRVAQTVDQDTMQYGLFGLLYEASVGIDATYQTASAQGASAAPSNQPTSTPGTSAAPSNIQAGATWIVAVSGIVITFLSAF